MGISTLSKVAQNVLHIIQSHQVEQLFQCMQVVLQQAQLDVFDMQEILIPSHGIGAWLKQQIANTQGICAQVNTNFIGSYQWKLYASVLGDDARQASPTSASMMQWQLFSYLSLHIKQVQDKKVLVNELTYQILAPLRQAIFSHLQHITFDKNSNIVDINRQLQQHIWHLAGQIAQVFAAYVIYRPDWLTAWHDGKLLTVKDLLGHHTLLSEHNLPEWETNRINQIQPWQAHLWQTLFAINHAEREQQKTRFWQILENDPYSKRKLPKHLIVFTVIQLPESELAFLHQLAQHTQLTLLHYNPTQEYWADSVDARWLKKIKLKHPDKAEAYHTHPILTRFGKQARDVFALLSRLAGQEDNSQWDDLFDANPPQATDSLLTQFQYDVLTLGLDDTTFQLNAEDNSIAFHACHSTMRQLEVLHDELVKWLAEEDSSIEDTHELRHKPKSRKPSDVVIFAPDLTSIEPFIRAVFDSNQYRLPYEITGLTASDTSQLWQAIKCAYTLLSGRVTITDWLDWLSLPAMQQAFNLDYDAIARIETLLVEAGFKRGFDAIHIKQTLANQDTDTRFTLRFALDRLLLAIAMPVPAIHAQVLPHPNIKRDDFELISILQQLFEQIDTVRNWLDSTEQPIEHWLNLLKQHAYYYFNQQIDSVGWLGIQAAFDELTGLIESSEQQQTLLPFAFVLQEVERLLEQTPQGAVPSGGITFAKLGTLRPLPYRVIALLDLDVGKLPKRPEPIRFDLMAMLPPKIGDRSRVEDDQGAFLDALLLAKDACWLFYNGFDVTDPHPRKPAIPVQELLDFLISKVPFTMDANIDTALSAEARRKHHPIYKQLWHEHTLQPFETNNFLVENITIEAAKPTAVATVWFEVAQLLAQADTLKNEQANPSLPWVNITTPLDDAATTRTAVKGMEHNEETKNIVADHWIAHLLSPERYFLQQAHIKNVYGANENTLLEPLTMKGLERYQLRELQLKHGIHHQQINDDETLLTPDFAPHILPVGAVQNMIWQANQNATNAQLARLAQLGNISPITQRSLQLFNYTWQITVPEDKRCNTWITVSPTSTHAKHQVRFWLKHLLWQVWRSTSQADVNTNKGYSIGVFSQQYLLAEPIEKSQAENLLQVWFKVWQQAATTPFVLPVQLGFNATLKESEEDVIILKADVTAPWLGSAFNARIAPQDDINCMLHPDWRLILQGQPQDSLALLQQFADLYAKDLYCPIHMHVTESAIIEEDLLELLLVNNLNNSNGEL